jgi:hypothetical protein
MSNTDNKTPAKSGRRNRKKEQKTPKPDQEISPRPDQLQDSEPEPVLAAEQPIEATVAAPASSPIEAAAPTAAGPIDPDAPAEPEPAEPERVSFQTIANAYGDFTRKSLEDTRSFVEQLSGARSLDKAMELQTEFARQAYQTFVAQAQKIRGLHGELARQTLKPLEDLVSKTGRDAD